MGYSPRLLPPPPLWTDEGGTLLDATLVLLEATLGGGMAGADEASIGDLRSVPPWRLAGRWFSMSASSAMYFRFRPFLVRGSGCWWWWWRCCDGSGMSAEIDERLASSELYWSMIWLCTSRIPSRGIAPESVPTPIYFRFSSPDELQQFFFPEFNPPCPARPNWSLKIAPKFGPFLTLKHTKIFLKFARPNSKC